MTVQEFLKKLRQGGQIVSSNDLTIIQIEEARACNRFYVDENNFGYAYFPPQKKIEYMKNLYKERFNNAKRKPVYKGTSETEKREGKKIGRNEPCGCGSGIKNKKCCNTK